jgi:hypothetical protein
VVGVICCDELDARNGQRGLLTKVLSRLE